MKWNHVFTQPSSGPNRTAFPSLDVLECIELEEILMFLDINCHCGSFFFVSPVCSDDKHVDSMVSWKIGSTQRRTVCIKRVQAYYFALQSPFEQQYINCPVGTKIK